MSSKTGWIGVDLDGTLAKYDKWIGVHHIGDPIPLMVDRVKEWLRQGITVKVFTARVHGHGQWLIKDGASDAMNRYAQLQELAKDPSAWDPGQDRPHPDEIKREIAAIEAEWMVDVITPIQEWCKKHIGQVLEVTNVKDYGMIELWDDRAVQVEMNTGRRIGDEPVAGGRSKSQAEEVAGDLVDADEISAAQPGAQDIEVIHAETGEVQTLVVRANVKEGWLVRLKTQLVDGHPVPYYDEATRQLATETVEGPWKLRKKQ